MSESTYLLPHEGEIEKKRLNQQHNILKEAFGWLLAPEITSSLKPGAQVLDVGTGTGAWILDLAQMPLPTPTTLHGIDISSSQFPTQPLTPALPPTVKSCLFTTHSLVSLPPSWSNTFTAVHQRLLSSALTRSAWSRALAEIHRILAPGGWVQLVEVDPRAPNAGPCHERLVKIQERMIRETAPMDNPDEGMVWATTDYLEEWLHEAGFVDVKAHKVLVPMVDSKSQSHLANGEGEEDYISSVMGFFGAIREKSVEMGYVRDGAEYDLLVEWTERELREMARRDERGEFGFTWWAVCGREPQV